MSGSLRRTHKQKAESDSPNESVWLDTSSTTRFFRPSLLGRSKRADGREHKSKRSIKASDIYLVMDISSENAAKLDKLSQSRSSEDTLPPAEGYDDVPTTPQRTSTFIIDNDFIDQFPPPPQVHAYSAPDVRVPTHVDTGHHAFPSTDLLPPPHPRVQQYIAEQKAHSHRRQPLSRSSSAVSYSRPTPTAYSALLQDSGSPDRSRSRNDSSSSHRPPPPPPPPKPPYNPRQFNRSTPTLSEAVIRARRPAVPKKSYSDLTTSQRWVGTPKVKISADVDPKTGPLEQPEIPAPKSSPQKSPKPPKKSRGPPVYNWNFY